MTTDGSRAHIDAERLAAWADHGLPAADAAEVELHLSQCERCQEVLAAFVRSEPAPAVVIPFFARRPVRWSAAGLAAAAAVFLIVRTQLPTIPDPDSVVAREESAAKAIPGPPVPSVSTLPATPPITPAASASAPAELQADKPDDLKRERQSSEGARRDARSNLADRAESKQAAANEQSARKEQQGRVAMPTAMPPPPRPATAPPAQATVPPPVQVTAAAPVVAPPPTVAPPGATVVGGNAGRAVSGIPAMAESVVMDSARGVIEILAPGPAVLRRLAAVDGGGAAGRGGAAPSEFRQQSAPARWRIFAGMRVELSLNAGATWTVLPIEPALTTPLVAGVAAGQSVCWLVGSEGVVLLTTDGRTFRRVSLPERVQLVSVTAEDERRATVTTSDGRKFSTADGGLTWK